MGDLNILNQEDFPRKENLTTYFLDLAAVIRSIVGNVSTMREMAWKIVASIPHQYTIPSSLSAIHTETAASKEGSAMQEERVRGMC